MKKRNLAVIAALVAMFFIVQAAMADVLFKYPVEANEEHAIGTVVRINPVTEQIVKATVGDRDVIGVVAGYETDGTTHYVLVASSGQLAVQVASAVSAGDRLTVSATPGMARTSVNTEDVLVAVALESTVGAGTAIAQIIVLDNQAKFSAFDDAVAGIGRDNVQGAIEVLDSRIDGLTGGSWDHNDLAGIQGGAADDHWHLTGAQHTALTGAGNADGQHSHDADNILGVSSGTYISSGNVDGALGQLDAAILDLSSGGTIDHGLQEAYDDGNTIAVATGRTVQITSTGATRALDVTGGSGRALQAINNGTTEALYARNDGSGPAIYSGGNLRMSGTSGVKIYSTADINIQLDEGGGPGTTNTFFIRDDAMNPAFTVNELGETWALGNITATNNLIGTDLSLGGTLLSSTAAASGARLVGYSNAASGLTATNVQSAIDELDGIIDGLTGGSWNHNDLSGIQGGAADDHWHLTGAQHTALTGGANADGQHSHNANNILGVTAGTYISSGNVDGALGQLDAAIVSNAGDITALDGRLTTAEGDITTNATDISNLEAAVGSSTGLTGLDYSSNNYVTDGTSLETAVGALDAAVKANEDAIDAIDFGAGQQAMSNSFSTAASLNSTSTWSNLASVTFTSAEANPVVLNFTGTFDDRGGQNGAYFEVRIWNGTTEIAKRTIIMTDRNFYQSQEVSINAHIPSPASGTTYTVQAKQVKAPYDAGRAVNGTLTLLEING
ncbi:MAG TPA: hypothetical protein ENN07_04830 [candidate division Zixibacteria bacterium]|nr:hypothetical protein [candidate division Zixibacteria bacterium]